MNDRTCLHCGHAIVAQTRYAAAKAAGLNVRQHEARGLCRPCYTHARNHGWREQIPQVRSGETGLRTYNGHGRTSSDIAWSEQERDAALTCAERVPANDLRHVLEALGLTTPTRKQATG